MSDREINILHTRLVTKTGGGPEKTILNSPRFLDKYGYSSACAYLHPEGDDGIETLKERAIESNCKLIAVPDKGAFDVSLIRKLLKICKERNVSIWHGHDYKTNAIGLLLRRFHKMHLVTTVHGWVQQTSKTPLYYWIDRQAIRRHDHTICVSEDLYNSCTDLGVPAERCTLIQNAIDTRDFLRTNQCTDAKQSLGFDKQRFLLGAVGRLAEEKGFDLLIGAVGKLIECGLDMGLIIVGEGDQKDVLQQQIDEAGHADRIRLLGYRSDTKDLYEAMDLFVLSSYREGLPNVVLEAMAMEVPVVATRIAGVPKLVRNRENGLLVEAGDDSQLEASIREMFLDHQLREKLTQNARKTIEEEFSFSVRMEKVRAIYDYLLSRSGNSRPPAS